MARGGRIKRIFPGGNTAQGFYSFFDSALQGLEKIYILKGGPGTGKSTLMRRIGLAMADRGYDIEFLCCSSDNDSLDGVIIPEIKLGIVDGTHPHSVEARHPGAVEQIVNFGDFWNERYLQSHREEIIACAQKIDRNYEEAYRLLAQANLKQIELDKFYLESIDLSRTNQIASKLVSEIFARKPVIRHLFASAITPEGIRNFFDNITQDIKNRYIIKGNPGTIKANLIEKVTQKAIDSGYSVEVYHCSLDPDCIDMVVIPDLSVAIIDGTAPHLLESERDDDVVIDMHDCVNMEDINAKSEEIKTTENDYNDKLTKAISYLNTAKKIHDELEAYYIAAMDFESLDAQREKLFNKILNYVAERKTN